MSLPNDSRCSSVPLLNPVADEDTTVFITSHCKSLMYLLMYIRCRFLRVHFLIILNPIIFFVSVTQCYYVRFVDVFLFIWRVGYYIFFHRGSISCWVTIISIPVYLSWCNALRHSLALSIVSKTTSNLSLTNTLNLFIVICCVFGLTSLCTVGNHHTWYGKGGRPP